MRLLVDINHPAHVHLLRPAIEAWRRRGDEVQVTARAKDVTLRLLRACGLRYQELAPIGRGTAGLARELVQRELALLRVARRFRPDVIVGTTVHAGRISRLLGCKGIVLNEDDAAAVPLFRWLAYPLTHAIVTPDCLAHENWGRRHWTYPSYHELFYLHPVRFRPDPSVLSLLGVEPGQPFGLVRLSALDAHHDRGVRGVREELLHAVLALLPPDCRLFVTGEKPVPKAFERLRVTVPPEKMHDVLAHARFFLGDSQTMTAEAAVLGVPALRLNDFVGRLSYLADLEARGLAWGFRPGEEPRLLQTLRELLAQADEAGLRAARVGRLLAEKIDPLPWFLDAVDALVAGRAIPKPALA